MEYFCHRVGSKITVDGNVHKPEWHGAKEIQLVDNVTGQAPKQPTSVKLLWDEEFLYAVFLCKDDFINASYTGYNEPLYDEEVVEIFLDDDRDLKTYIEVEVNPLNALLHYEIHNRLQGGILKFGRVDSPVRTAVHREDGKGLWSVEIAVPFTEFASAENIPPRPGDRWLMNLYRIDRPRDGADEYTAWSPTGLINYHLPQYFGEIIFE